MLRMQEAAHLPQICQNLEATRCHAIGEWIHNVWPIQAMECYPPIKKSYKPRKARVELKCLSLRDRSQSGKAAYYMILTLRHSGKSKMMEP